MGAVKRTDRTGVYFHFHFHPLKKYLRRDDKRKYHEMKIEKDVLCWMYCDNLQRGPVMNRFAGFEAVMGDASCSFNLHRGDRMNQSLSYGVIPAAACSARHAAIVLWMCRWPGSSTISFVTSLARRCSARSSEAALLSGFASPFSSIALMRFVRSRRHNSLSHFWITAPSGLWGFFLPSFFRATFILFFIVSRLCRSPCSITHQSTTFSGLYTSQDDVAEGDTATVT